MTQTELGVTAPRNASKCCISQDRLARRLKCKNRKANIVQLLSKVHRLSWADVDFVERYAAHVVVTWLGNSERVALKHDLKVTPMHLDDASKQGLEHNLI